MMRVTPGVPRETAWLVAVLLIAVAAVVPIVHYSSLRAPSPLAPAADPAVQFGTLPPGAKLPSGAQCARLVRASPSPENRPANEPFNKITGRNVSPSFFVAGDSPKVRTLASRIDGDFTGTTEEILRWAACKWGIDQNIVFAQAAAESWWEQDELGDWGKQAAFCPPGHGLGADGRPGQCPASYGILQDKYVYEKPGWPVISTSTAMNVDAAYAIWRSCYDGYEVWLNNEPRGKQYHAGDVWGCVGRWSAGSWYTPEADQYIALVKEYIREHIWTQPVFNKTDQSVPRKLTGRCPHLARCPHGVISEDGSEGAEVGHALSVPAVPEQGEPPIAGELRAAAGVGAQPPDSGGQLSRVARLEILDDVIVVGLSGSPKPTGDHREAEHPVVDHLVRVDEVRVR